MTPSKSPIAKRSCSQCANLFSSDVSAPGYEFICDWSDEYMDEKFARIFSCDRFIEKTIHYVAKYEASDGYKKRRRFKTWKGLARFIYHYTGHTPDENKPNQRSFVSDDGVGRVWYSTKQVPKAQD